MYMNVKIDGVKQLEKKLKNLEPKLGKKVVRQALRKAAKPVAAAAKANVPFKSGALKKSIKVRAMKKRRHQYGIMVATSEGWFKGDEFYGAFLEFGTSKMPAKPFVRPAFDAEKDNAEKIITTELKKGIEQVGASK